MRLLVHIIEARHLWAQEANGGVGTYVRLQLGKQRFKTMAMKSTLNPLWDEEFSFLVDDHGEKLTISVVDGDKCFGRVKFPISKVLHADNLSVGTAWHQLLPKSKRSKNKSCGEIRLTISLSQRNSFCDEILAVSQTSSQDFASNSDKSTELIREISSSSSSCNMELSCLVGLDEAKPIKDDKSNATSVVDLVRQFFLGKNLEVSLPTGRDLDCPGEFHETLAQSQIWENQIDEPCSNMSFDELLKTMESKDQGGKLPESLAGGVLINQSYVISPRELNHILFSPSSKFSQSMAELNGTSGLQSEPWKFENGGASLRRVMTYTKAPSKLTKAVRATEEQTYLKADGKSYAVLASVSIPDVPFGSYFKTEILYCITLGPELSSEEQSSNLLISWRMHFIQSTMMKGMIEKGAKQGLTESFSLFADMLSQNVKVVDFGSTECNEKPILTSVQMEQETNWKLSLSFLGNFTIIFSIFVGVYVFMHIIVVNQSMIQGLEFVGLDLPDSIGEIIICGLLVLQGKYILSRMGRLLQAWNQRGSDHGVRAQGHGWLLTVALIEGSSLAAMGSSGSSFPYVVFTCNGKTKTSSIKFQVMNPQWNEIFEFDAMYDPPSRMDVVVYDFDGPFDEPTSLGHAEVNFVKSNLSDLADMWIPLQGTFAQACQSKLHLRIFLNNTQGTEVITEYLKKMGKEVGKKISLRSPQTNSTFQKLFGLPPEEFLIDDFVCYLKRKMPLQGRLFLSPRIIGFYTNLFGHKTKFFFLWEDIDDIQVIPPSLPTIGIIVIILQRGRGLEAKHGAKSLDQDGRLKFHFQSFVYFNDASRTIMTIWKARSLSREQKAQIVEEHSKAKHLHTEENVSFLCVEDAKLSEVFSSTISVSGNSLMEIFEGGSLECKVMKKVGCFDYSSMPWEPIKDDVLQRQISYKFDKSIFNIYGGEVTSSQQKSHLPDKNGWVVEEALTVQGNQLGDYLRLQLKYVVENLPSETKSCIVQVSLGIGCLKSTKHEKKITKGVMSSTSLRLKEIFRQVEKELMHGK